MGVTSALIGVAASIFSGIKSANDQKKAQQAQARAAEEAAKRNVTVTSQAEDPTNTQIDTQEDSDTAAQNARKRKMTLASTVRGTRSSLLGSLTSGRRTLGGA